MTWQVTTEPEKRELRFCLCGWYICGTEQERGVAFDAHWETKDHKEKLKAREAK